MSMYTVGLKALLPTLGVIYGFQAACAAIAVPLKTEKYYDLCGSLGFISAAGLSLYMPWIRARTSTASRMSRCPPRSRPSIRDRRS